jgi:hypothetical protein
MSNIPISKGIIEPIKVSNIFFINSLEEFESIELQINETRLAFDNNRQCFYLKERDKYGEYSPVKIYFYEDFSNRVQSIEREEFIKKCRDAGLSDLKTEIAIMFFLENKKPLEVWEWSLKNTTKDWEWDYVRSLKYKLKVKLFKKVT